MYGQASTLTDYGNFITINYDTGDTISIGKASSDVYMKNGKTYIVPSSGINYVNRTISLEYADFGYATNHELWMKVASLIYRVYDEVYSYEDSNLDTVSYYYDSERQYRVVYGYSGTLVTSKTIVTQ